MDRATDLPPSYDDSSNDVRLVESQKDRSRSASPSAALMPIPAKDGISSALASVQLAEAPAAPDSPLGSASSKAPPSSSPLLSPPLYARNDPAAQVYAFRPPLICSTTASTAAGPSASWPGMPRYQLAQRNTKSGRPYQLHLRPLVPSEGRRLSLKYESSSKLGATPLAPSVSAPGNTSISPIASRPTVPYDDDTTLYIISMGTASRGEMWSPRPLSSRTLAGIVRLEGVSAMGSQGVSGRWWHVTRNAAGDSMRPENQAKMKKWGYHSREEWQRKLLFEIRTPARGERMLEWRDAEGKIVGLELERDGQMQLIGAEEMGARTREVLTACWAAKCWYSGNWPWEDIEGMR